VAEAGDRALLPAAQDQPVVADGALVVAAAHRAGLGAADRFEMRRRMRHVADSERNTPAAPADHPRGYRPD
jgi:hypothetical protein